MKIKNHEIGKYFNGGEIVQSIGQTYNPLPISTTPLPQETPTATTDTKEDKAAAKAKKQDDDAAKKLVGDGKGLIADVSVVMSRRNAAYNEYETLDDFQKQGPRGRQLLAILQGTELNDVSRYTAHFDKAKSTMDSNESNGDIAYTQNGAFVQLKDGTMRSMSISQLDKLKEGEDFYYMTVQDVMWAREQNPSLALHRGTDAITAMQYTSGTKQTAAAVRDIASKVAASTSEAEGGLGSKDPAAQMVAQLINGSINPENMEKASTNWHMLMRAAGSIYENLTPSQKMQIEIQAHRSFGEGEEKTKEAINAKRSEILIAMMQPYAKYEVKSVTVDGKGNPKGKGGGTPGLTDVAPGGYFQTIGGRTGRQTIKMGAGDGHEASVNGYTMSSLGNTRGIRADLVDGGKFATFANIGKAKDENGNEIDRDSLVLMGGPIDDKPVYTMLAVDSNGKVDMSLTEKYEALRDAVLKWKQDQFNDKNANLAQGEAPKAVKDPTPEQLKEIAEKNKLTYVDGLMFKAHVVAKARWGESDSFGAWSGFTPVAKNQKEVKGEERDLYMAALKDGSKEGETSSVKAEGLDNWLDTRIIEGNVFIPVDSGEDTALQLDGSKLFESKTQFGIGDFGANVNDPTTNGQFLTTQNQQSNNLYGQFNVNGIK